MMALMEARWDWSGRKELKSVCHWAPTMVRAVWPVTGLVQGMKSGLWESPDSGSARLGWVPLRLKNISLPSVPLKEPWTVLLPRRGLGPPWPYMNSGSPE
jgi:hypothetical protein